MSKIKKYIIGFFTLLGGIFVAFLSGRSAGKKDEKFKNIKKNIKDTEKSTAETEKNQKYIQETLKSKKKTLEEIKKQREVFETEIKNTSAQEAEDFLKKYAKNKQEKNNG